MYFTVRVFLTLTVACFLRHNAQAICRKFPVNRLLSEATMGFEPMMRVLQTLALPLGDVAAG
jgi:hypothetical protein